MKFQDLLNFLDNMMNVSASARYHNIDFADCKLIIVTSIFTPSKCYKSEAILDEPIQQLYRRLGFRISKNKDEVIADKTYLYIGSINSKTLEFEKKPATSISEGYVATYNAETDEILDDRQLLSMSGPYNDMKRPLSNLDMASVLGLGKLEL